MCQETPQLIAQFRQVSAEYVLAGRLNVAEYPPRHLAVVTTSDRWQSRLAAVLAAADLLATAGFVLTNVTQFDHGTSGYATCAVLRRR